VVTVEEKYAAEKKTWEKEEKPKFDASLAPVTKQRDKVVKEQGRGVLENKHSTDVESPLSARPYEGVIKNKHSTDVEYPPPPLRICMRGWRTSTRSTLHLPLLLRALV
jgi:hypothetical protein